MNNHYVSRVVTKPWEFGNKELYFFDFEESKFDSERAKTLFAEQDIFPEDYELFKNQSFESILGSSRDPILKSKKISWKTFKSLWLYIILQPGSSSVLSGVKYSREELMNLSKEEINGFITYLDNKFNLIKIIDNSCYNLFVNPLGYFPIFLNSGLNVIMAYPIHPKMAIVVTPKKIDYEYIKKSGSIEDNLLSKWSIGTGKYCNKIVVYPPLLKKLGTEKLKQRLQNWRSQLNDLCQLNNEYAECITRAGATTSAWYTS